MIRIAVCDDFKDTVNQVDGYLSEYQQLRDRKLDIKSFFNAEDLWEYLRKNRCDLIILDIELVKMNGVELGHLIRTELKDNIIKIVYISAKNCYVFDFEVKGNGNILSDLYVRKSNLVQSIDTDYVIGDIPEIIYEGGDIDSITLIFEINENNIFENPVAPELSGVNGFAVFMYDAEEGMLVPVDTVYDEENNKISATVDKPGSYAVVDLYTWAEYISDMLEMFEEGEPEEADIEAEGSNETMIQEEEFDVIAESDETVAEATEYDETIAEAEGDDDLSEEKTLFMVPQILKTAPAPSKIDSSTPLDFVIRTRPHRIRTYARAYEYEKSYT